MNDMTEQEQDAAAIGLFLQIHDRLRWYHNNGLVPRLDDYENADAHFRSHVHEFAEATRRELDRLHADNARLREQVNAIVAWAESCDDSANNPDLDADVAHDRKESAQDIFRLLGIEAHK